MKSCIAAIALAVVSSVTAAPTIKRNNGLDDTVILNFALTLEHLENAFYMGALKRFSNEDFINDGLPPWARGRFQQIADHEATHVQTISSVLGDQATQPCQYTFPYNTPKEFAALSQIFEGVGVTAYSGAAQFIQNKEYLTTAAVILSTEARQAAWVASAVNKIEPWSGAFDVALTMNEVFTLASPFIVSCPPTNPTLPVKAFPTLTVGSSNPKPGDTVSLTFNGSNDSQVAVFLTGLDMVTAPIKDGKVTIPASLRGTVYLVISNDQSGKVSDATTVAGPALLQFHFDSNNNLI
ncbi:hypothetical protein BDZ89DRAFT_1101675 [Hymenopellis radicata]|nr:hypothetical protein BDZ89DRAFT_1101675 [Hymenopellis radicata]